MEITITSFDMRTGETTTRVEYVKLLATTNKKEAK